VSRPVGCPRFKVCESKLTRKKEEDRWNEPEDTPRKEKRNESATEDRGKEKFTERIGKQVSN